MSEELEKLFACAPETKTSLAEFARLVIDENCLLKASMSSRRLTFSHLKTLYDLDMENVEFSAFRNLWSRKKEATGLLCLQYACIRDVVVAKASDYFLKIPYGEELTTEKTYHWVEENYPKRFSIVTATTVAKDLNSSWYQAGFFKGTRPRKRIKAKVSVENVVFALYLAYLNGYRGMLLLDNEYTRLLEQEPNETLANAEEAARNGLLVVRHLGDVLDVQFPLFSSKGDLA